MLALFLAETGRHQLQEAKSNRKIRVSLAKDGKPPSPTVTLRRKPIFRHLRLAFGPKGAPLAIYVISVSGKCVGRTFTRRRSIANTMASDILIVDDEADICELVAGILQDEGHGTRTARDSDEALAAVVARRPNLVFLDIWLKGSKLDGLQLLDSLKQEHPELPIVMISGHGNIETAVSAIKRGAYDFIEKPSRLGKFAARRL